jgi:hypothetical protein
MNLNKNNGKVVNSALLSSHRSGAVNHSTFRTVYEYVLLGISSFHFVMCFEIWSETLILLQNAYAVV